MAHSEWLSCIPGLAVDAVVESDGRFLVQCHTTATGACCPICGQCSQRVHSYRTRHIRDLPVDEHRVELELRYRHFRCVNDACPRRTFAERLSEQIGPRVRRTTRLSRAWRVIGLALGGEAGRRLCQHLSMPISGDTLLRLVRQASLPVCTPQALGVDDWAWRRGHRYGTLLVNLETHRPIDLLADRTAETLSAWLKCHPGIRVITRDRSGEYARGISLGAPRAQQVADRWHLLHNLREALDRLLQSKVSDLQRLPPVSGHRNGAISAWDRSSHRSVRDDVQRQLARARRQRRYRRIKALQRQGFKIQSIARALQMGWATVRQFYRADCYPEPKRPRRRSSMLDPYVTYLQARWDAGCHTALRLWREIRTQGYPGSYRMVMLWAQVRRTPSEVPRGRPLSSPVRSTAGADAGDWPPTRQLVWLLLRDRQSLSADELSTLKRLEQDASLAAAYRLAQQFTRMLRQRTPAQLSGWLARCAQCGVAELANFATTLRHDLKAVKAALKLPWSNGVVEGHVNRLKFIKRQMFGRANFDLLRIRVLAQL